MSEAYFGYPPNGADPAAPLPDGSWTGYYGWNEDNNVYTCPGTGTQRVSELSAWVGSVGGIHGNIRLGIYDTSNNLLGEGIAEVEVGNDVAGWIGHVGIANIKQVGGANGSAVNLTGGVNYKVAYTQDASDTAWYYESFGSSTYHYGTGDLTGGMIADLPAGTQSSANAKYCTRVGVDSVAEGPIVSFNYPFRDPKYRLPLISKTKV